MRISVEIGHDQVSSYFLDKVSEAVTSLGHTAIRWSGPETPSGNVNPLPACEMAVLWNGMEPNYDAIVAVAKRNKVPLLFAEKGWTSHTDRFQLDPEGVHAFASWSAEPIVLGHNGNVKNQLDCKAMAVYLQYDQDIAIRRLSPWFSNACDFVKFLMRNITLELELYPDPRMLDNGTFKHRDMRNLIANNPALKVFTNEHPDHRVAAVATINDDRVVVPLEIGLPILCYGHAAYRHKGVVYCLDDRPWATKQVMEKIRHKPNCDLSIDMQYEMYSQIKKHEWTIEEIPKRLARILATETDNANTTEAVNK